MVVTTVRHRSSLGISRLVLIHNVGCLLVPCPVCSTAQGSSHASNLVQRSRTVGQTASAYSKLALQAYGICCTSRTASARGSRKTTADLTVRGSHSCYSSCSVRRLLTHPSTGLGSLLEAPATSQTPGRLQNRHIQRSRVFPGGLYLFGALCASELEPHVKVYVSRCLPLRSPEFLRGCSMVQSKFSIRYEIWDFAACPV